TLIHGAIRISSESQFFQITYIQVMIVIVSLISMGVLTYILQNTNMGRACRAVQQDRTIASILGINTDRTISTLFVIGAALAAEDGVLVTLNYVAPRFYIGFLPGGRAFTAAVLRGNGSLPGVMLGGIILGISESLLSGFVSPDYKDVFAFS